MSALRALAVLPLVLVLACSSGGEVPATQETSPGQQAPATSQPPASEDGESVSVKPSAEIEGECERVPATTEDGRRVLRADLRAVNTGNIGINARVAAFWRQPEGRTVSHAQKMRIDQGKSKNVRLRLVIGANEAEAIEQVSERRRCRIGIRVTGAYGEPAD